MVPRTSLRSALAAAFLPLFLGVPYMTAATPGKLLVDGKLKVKGGGLEGARMIMVDGTGAPTVLEQGLAHFVITLDLNSTYLLSFERPGCVSKEVLFDTSLPFTAITDEQRSFLFEVTLQAPPDGQQFEYAGPVAFVHYVAGLHDFGYDTDYRIKAPVELVEQLARVRHDGVKAARHSAAIVAPVRVDSAVAPTIRAEELRHGDAEMPLVHPTGGTPETQTTIRARTATVPADPANVSHSAASPRATAVVRGGTSMPPDPVRFGTTACPLAASNTGRQEEVEVEHLRVTRIVRVCGAGKVTEYRRVETRYGQVYYFRDAQPVPATVFFSAVGR